MGAGITREKARLFKREHKEEMLNIKYKFDQRENRNIVLIGPNQSGKTQLMNALCDLKFSKKYTENETAKIGYKLFSTIKSNYQHLYPIAFTVTVTPGSFIKHLRAAPKYFEACQCILIVIDMSDTLSEELIVQWTAMILKQVEEHHSFFKNQKNALPPFICHVFTKVDLLLNNVREANIHKLRDMQNRGVIGHYLFVSSKTGAGLDELKTAIFDCDIDNGNRELEPSEKMDPIKKISKARRRIERKKLRKLEEQQKNKKVNMLQTFTAGFASKSGPLDKFQLGDIMDDEAESAADPYDEQEEHSDDSVDLDGESLQQIKKDEGTVKEYEDQTDYIK